MDKTGLITLEPKGLAIAQEMLDRHHTLTNFLVRLGVDQETAEADACKIEHDISPQTFAAICRHAGSTRDKKQKNAAAGQSPRLHSY